MQAILQRQIPNASIGASTLTDNSKKIEDLQRAQAKDNEQIINSLTETNGDGLNSNIIKLFREVKKLSSAVEKRSLTGEEAEKITSTSAGRRQFNTLKPRMESRKEGFKDLLTMRGFLDKTGLIPRSSGGIFSEYLDRGEAKKNYVDQRMKTKGTTFGSRETFAKQFDEQQKIQYEIGKNEKEIQKLRESGATDAGLKRSGLLGKREELATNLAKVDPSVRPEGFDPKTGKIKVAPPETATDQEQKAKSKEGKVIPFSAGADALSNQESMLEQNRMVAEQSELLKKIEENTRGLKGGVKGSGTTQQAPQQGESGGLDLMDMLGSGKGKLGKIAKTAGRGLLSGAKTAGSFLLKRAGPLAAVAAVGTGAYEGYKGFTSAGEKQKQALAVIQSKLQSGEITKEEAAKMQKEASETATVEKNEAVGKGTGAAVGGAVGALKGAAVGAAIGSVIPVVGTVIGGAVGATIGAFGGGYLGGKAGGWLGRQTGKASNFVRSFFGGSQEEINAKEAKSEGSSTNIQFSEMEFAKKDPDTYKKFTEHRNKLVEEYAQKQAKKFKHEQPTRDDYAVAKMLADKEAIIKFRSEIEAVGAGKISGGAKETPKVPGEKTADALKKTANSVVKPVENIPQPSGNLSSREEDIQRNMSNAASTGYDRVTKAIIPTAAPGSGDILNKKSSETAALKEIIKSTSGGNTVVSAPTINNNTTNQTSSVKLSPRNTDSTINKYLNSRYAM